jgi:hypothetical protein
LESVINHPFTTQKFVIGDKFTEMNYEKIIRTKYNMGVEND